jgi:hypothetical protein
MLKLCAGGWSNLCVLSHLPLCFVPELCVLSHRPLCIVSAPLCFVTLLGIYIRKEVIRKTEPSGKPLVNLSPQADRLDERPLSGKRALLGMYGKEVTWL